MPNILIKSIWQHHDFETHVVLTFKTDLLTLQILNHALKFNIEWIFHIPVHVLNILPLLPHLMVMFLCLTIENSRKFTQNIEDTGHFDDLGYQTLYSCTV